MARQIVTWCDAHLAKGEQVTGQTWTVALTVPGGKPREFELDACDDCSAPFFALLGDLQDNARQISGSKASPSQPHPSDTAVAPAAGRGPGPTQCPKCPAMPSSRNALDGHLRQYHDLSLAEWEGTATHGCPVDGCERKLSGGTGRTAHVRNSHPEWFAAHPDRSAWPDTTIAATA